MIDLHKDQLLSMAQAARLLPERDGSRPHPSTLWRFCRKGIRSRAGGRVICDSVRVGARLYTTVRALNEFFAKVAKADAAYFQQQDTGPPTRGTSDPAREREIAEAQEFLKEEGI